MTAALRKTHPRVWVALTALLALLVIVGLVARQETMPPNPIRWEQLR